MAELARLSAPTACVLRDGRTVEVPASGLVPGDHVLLAGGPRARGCGGRRGPLPGRRRVTRDR
ncbi:hypothetical protein EUA06_21405 [Nocardioides glacieisoli]|uniref:P-type ATPase A domain-containing protein n=1 Tax=Nocardioides glacieisoli TaxID=1168730 RepID=A0A4Q2RMV1_9ACTN|nr:hypothetical protein EUA06_21405 [Nocardioides glacieisoli]